ncbi:MAG: 8-oxo-dGTP diphosphatase MutT [Acidobacteria bacterium]|nr:8-oxo-dGTP diphosphatase MutT [Acidobacteriota bacterium]MCB9398323.1 8-oxo-dGTP diphosphatase MutT [Acidobacteriota bacterium]
MKNIDVAVGIVEKAGYILIARRLQSSHMGGFWEFPGGKIQQGESAVQTVLRELVEECALKVETLGEICHYGYAFEDRYIQFTFIACRWLEGEAKPHAAQEIRWVPVQDLGQFPFPPANALILEKLQMGGWFQAKDR